MTVGGSCTTRARSSRPIPSDPVATTAPPVSTARAWRPVIELRSSRLVLCETRASDADELFDAIDPAVARFMAWDVPKSRAVHRARVEARAADGDGRAAHFTIRRRDGHDCLGAAGVEALDTERPEIGLWLRTSAQGHGYGTEAVRTLLAWAGDRTGRAAFAWPVAPDNVPSVRLAERLGGRVVGRRRRPKHEALVYLVPVPPRPDGPS